MKLCYKYIHLHLQQSTGNTKSKEGHDFETDIVVSEKNCRISSDNRKWYLTGCYEKVRLHLYKKRVKMGQFLKHKVVFNITISRMYFMKITYCFYWHKWRCVSILKSKNDDFFLSKPRYHTAFEIDLQAENLEKTRWNDAKIIVTFGTFLNMLFFVLRKAYLRNKCVLMCFYINYMKVGCKIYIYKGWRKEA